MHYIALVIVRVERMCMKMLWWKGAQAVVLSLIVPVCKPMWRGSRRII